MNAMIPAWIGNDLVAVEKLEVHLRGLRHKAVSVFILHGEEVLIQRRAMCKYHTPGLWANTCCTHPHWDEDPEDCAIRRLDEELGIKAHSLMFRNQVEYRADVGNDLIEHELVDVFLWRVAEKVPMEPNPDEVMDTRWVDLGQLRREIAESPDSFTPWLRIYLDNHSAQIFD